MPRRTKGDGGITQRHDHQSCPPAVAGTRPDHRCQGRWVATLDLGWLGGKRRRKVMYGRTRAEVAQKLSRAQRERDNSTLVIASPTLEAWLRYWLDVICVERGLKINTMKSHRSKVETYLIPQLGRHRVDRLAPEHVRGLYAWMRKEGLAEATLRQTHAILRRALEVAVREGKATRNVAAVIDPPGTATKKRIGLSVEQAWVVLARDELRWWVALFLGLRQGEALALRWSDIDLENAVLYVSRELVRQPGVGLVYDTPKSAAGTRPVPIPPQTLARFKLAAIGADLTGLVFHRNGKPIDHRADWQAWTDVLDACGLPHVALHAARNTTASLLEAAGVQDRMAAQILGQSTVQVLHGYQHQDLPRMAEAMLALEQYVSPADTPSTPE